MPCRLRVAARAAVCALSILACACDYPPEKEMHIAQGALDAARAAGAEQYAPQEYQDAVRALKQAQQAVTQRDYRLALNYALDSQERAQAAAKAAADQKATVRSEADQLIGTAAALVTEAQSRLVAADAARVPPRSLEPSRRAVATAQASVQEARTAVAGGQYLAAREGMKGVADQLRGAIQQINDTIASRPIRRKR